MGNLSNPKGLEIKTFKHLGMYFDSIIWMCQELFRMQVQSFAVKFPITWSKALSPTLQLMHWKNERHGDVDGCSENTL